MTRVAYFAPLLFTGGTQRHLQQVLRHLDPRHFAAHVYTLRSGGELTDELRAAGVSVTSLELGERLTRPRVLAGVIRAARLLRAALQPWPGQVVAPEPTAGPSSAAPTFSSRSAPAS